MGTLNVGTYILIDTETGEEYKNMTAKMICEEVGSCMATVKRHCASGRILKDRYYILQPDAYVKRDFTRYYPEEWIRAFSSEWISMQRLFGVGVSR